jgi:hypothetical protein
MWIFNNKTVPLVSQIMYTNAIAMYLEVQTQFYVYQHRSFKSLNASLTTGTEMRDKCEALKGENIMTT